MSKFDLGVNVFITGISLCYLSAFVSLYTQLYGLYGSRGILPIQRLKNEYFSKNILCHNITLNEFTQNPSFYCLIHYFKISPIYLMETFCIMGIIISFISLISFKLKYYLTMIIYFLLWILYLQLFIVGQTFIHFQWDILLLEIGFITIFINVNSFNNTINFLIRWLLFRLMFSSGIVKLQSNCPTWWNLTALDWHYESQCIPTILSWYTHNLPKWINHFSVVIMYFIEGPMTVLFLIPKQIPILRLSRIIAAYLNILLMSIIIITGNYNFFNILTIVLSISCLDNKNLNWVLYPFYKVLKYFLGNNVEFNINDDSDLDKETKTSRIVRILSYGLDIIVWFGFIYFMIKIFNIDIEIDLMKEFELDISKILAMIKSIKINGEITFSMHELNDVGSKFIMASVILGYINLLICILYDLYDTIRDKSNIIFYIYGYIKLPLRILITIFIFHISLIPYIHSVDQAGYTQKYIYSESTIQYIRDLYIQSESFRLTSSYGLFRRMTGVGGRPEIEIYVTNDKHPKPLTKDNSIISINDEYSKLKKGGWYRIPFYEKPGELHMMPQYILPHQNRLDWQMWFAALGEYNRNPWFISLIYRLLNANNGHKDYVFDIINKYEYPFSMHFNIDKHAYVASKEDTELKRDSSGNIIFNSKSLVKILKQSFNDYFGYSNDNVTSKIESKKEIKRNEKKRELFERMMHSKPKYITAILYHYHYTTFNESKDNYWKRDYKKEYFPIIKAGDNDDMLKSWMKDNGYLKKDMYHKESQNNRYVKMINEIRQFYRIEITRHMSNAQFVQIICFMAIIIRICNEYVKRKPFHVV